MKFHKLNPKGIAHVIAPLVAVVAIGIVGTAVIVSSHADSVNKPIKISSIRIKAPDSISATVNPTNPTVACGKANLTFIVTLQGVRDGGHVSSVMLNRTDDKTQAAVHEELKKVSKPPYTYQVKETRVLCNDIHNRRVNVGGSVETIVVEGQNAANASPNSSGPIATRAFGNKYVALKIVKAPTPAPTPAPTAVPTPAPTPAPKP